MCVCVCMCVCVREVHRGRPSGAEVKAMTVHSYGPWTEDRLAIRPGLYLGRFALRGVGLGDVFFCEVGGKSCQEVPKPNKLCWQIHLVILDYHHSS